MLYVYTDREGNEREFSQSQCERMIAAEGLTFVGHRMSDGKLYEAERGRRARATQNQAFDEMIESKIWSVDERQQLKDWGVL